MRFLLFDRITLLEPGRRAVAVKTVELDGSHFETHHPRLPVLSGTLLLESMAQLAGWLNLASHGFAVHMVLAMMDKARLHARVRAGDTLSVEVSMLYTHPDGATARGEIRRGDELVASVERMVFANQLVDPAIDPEPVAQARERFRYLSGDLLAMPLAEAADSEEATP